MTIAIGLLCRDGVVLAADREVSIGDTKVNGRKAHLLKKPNWVVGLVGAGSFELIEWAKQELDQRLKADMSADEIQSEVAKLAADLHDHVSRESRHSIDLLVGLKAIDSGKEGFRLLSVAGTIVVRCDSYKPLGTGAALAHYLLERFYDRSDNLDVSRAIILAAHIIKAVKSKVQGCGGDTDVMHIAPGVKAVFVSEAEIAIHENAIERIEKSVRSVMHAVTDVNVNGRQFSDLVGKMSEEIVSARPMVVSQRSSEVKVHKVTLEPETSSSVSSLFIKWD